MLGEATKGPGLKPLLFGLDFRGLKAPAPSQDAKTGISFVTPGVFSARTRNAHLTSGRLVEPEKE
jgi:hypothetical protein